MRSVDCSLRQRLGGIAINLQVSKGINIRWEWRTEKFLGVFRSFFQSTNGSHANVK